MRRNRRRNRNRQNRRRHPFRMSTNMTTPSNRRNALRPTDMSNAISLSMTIRMINHLITLMIMRVLGEGFLSVNTRKVMEFIKVLLSITYCLYLDLLDYILTEHDPVQHNEWRRTMIDDYGNEEARFYFRFTGVQLRIILTMFDLPVELRNDNGSVFLTVSNQIKIILYFKLNVLQETCFLVFLAFIAKGYTDLDMAYGIFAGDPRRIGDMRHLFVDVIYNKFNNRITGYSLRIFAPRFEQFRQAIFNKMNETSVRVTTYNGIEIDNVVNYVVTVAYETFRIIGFIDDSALPCCTPFGICLWNQIVYSRQRVFYR